MFEHVQRLAAVVVAVVDVDRPDRFGGADGGAPNTVAFGLPLNEKVALFKF